MGLPMFREPEEVVVEDVAAKLDRVTASRRSTIRREATVRPGRYSSSTPSDRIRDTRREGHSDRTRLFLYDDARDANQQIAELEAELERLRSIRMRRRARLERDGGQTPHNRTHRQESMLLQDAMDLLNHSRPNPQDNDDNTNYNVEELSATRQTVNRHLPRPPRESNLRFEMGVSSPSATSPRLAPLLSPPISTRNGERDRSIPDGPLLFDEESPTSLTPGFAPARGPYHSLFHDRSVGNDEYRALGTPPAESWEASYPPLRRVGHISPRPLGLPPTDASGDYQRSRSSLSANHEEVEEETWANLLTTMGGVRSSTSTSFASTRSDSANRSRSSQNTSTSFGEIGQFDESCDLDLPLGITEDDVRQIRDQHRIMSSREVDGLVMTGEQGLRESRERRARRLDLGMFQNILERMQRREDIPDEWWAAVGLTPDMVRNA